MERSNGRMVVMFIDDLEPVNDNTEPAWALSVLAP
jgi:hypothetical protein